LKPVRIPLLEMAGWLISVVIALSIVWLLLNFWTELAYVMIDYLAGKIQ
jgi:hypothetical protein